MGFTWRNSHVAYVAIECSIATVSALSNGLVLLTLWKNRTLRNVTNMLIGSLAMADLLFNLLAVPMSVLRYTGMPRDFYSCLVLNSLTVILANLSIITLLIITLDRFVAIAFPFWHRSMVSVKWKAYKLISLAWLISTVLGLVPLMGWHPPISDFRDCSFLAVIPITYMVYLFFLGITLPCLLCMLVVYTSIFILFRKQHQRRMNMRRFVGTRASNVSMGRVTIHESNHSNRTRRIVKCMFLIVLTFAVCWLPINITNSVSVFTTINVQIEVVNVVILLSHASSAVNPFLYAFYMQAFRKAIRNILVCGGPLRIEASQISSQKSSAKTEITKRLRDDDMSMQSATGTGSSCLSQA